jgi:elongation factor P hydroxylase
MWHDHNTTNKPTAGAAGQIGAAMSTTTDSRYPYTHACDYLRQFGGVDRDGVRLSRSDASKIRQAVAKAIGMDDEELAKKLADYAQANDAELSEAHMRNLTAALGLGRFA